MAWLAPGALAALALLAGPIVVHLLARRNARRVVFPATHFVRTTQAAAVRFRRPSDVPLLLVRMAIVAAAVLAAAQPLFLTRWRLAAWNARVSRVVIAAGYAESTPSNPGTPRQQLADQEMATAYRAQRIDTADLADGLARAAPWLEAAPPSRREVVIVSDFRRGSIERGSLDVLPAGVGVRLIRAGAGPAERTAALPAVDGWRGSRWVPTVTVDASGTRTSWTEDRRSLAGRSASGGGSIEDRPEWVTIVAPPADAAAAERAKRAAASFGVSAGDDTHRVRIVFAGAQDEGEQPVHTRWIARAAQALRDSDLLQEVDADVSVGERDGAFVVRAPVTASSLAAPAIVRAAMLAVRPAAIADRRLETLTIPDAELAQWRRDPVPFQLTSTDLSSVARATDSDARWFWALALVLIGVETWMRRPRRSVTRQEAHADAA
jgi:Aerotolerance regulator N-terminal